MYTHLNKYSFWFYKRGGKCKMGEILLTSPSYSCFTNIKMLISHTHIYGKEKAMKLKIDMWIEREAWCIFNPLCPQILFHKSRGLICWLKFWKGFGIIIPLTVWSKQNGWFLLEPVVEISNWFVKNGAITHLLWFCKNGNS